MKMLMTGLLLALLCLGTIPGPSQAANPCFSALDDALNVHIPALVFGTQAFVADLAYNPSGPAGAPGILFKLNLSTFAASALTSCSNPARLFLDGSAWTVRLPMITFSGGPLWAELQYVPTTDGEVWLQVSSAGFMPNQVFVTSDSGNGNLSTWENAGGLTGLAAGDAICQHAAVQAGLLGTYRAWLSDSADDAYCRIVGLSGKKSANCGQAALPAAAGPWVRTDGFPFGGTIDQITTIDAVYAPAATNEQGSFFSFYDWQYFTNTWTDGTLSDPSNTCNDMTTGDSSVSGRGGGAAATGRGWTAQWGGGCSGASSLLCFQVGSGPTLPPFALPGKRVFVSSTAGNGNLSTWPGASGATGVEAGDAVCRTLAAAAALPNASSYKALLSTSASDVKDRIISDGPWVRLDGVLVADSKADLLDGTLFAPINITEQNSALAGNRAWTGSLRNGTKQPGTCGDWTQATAGTSDVGVVYEAGRAWADWNTFDCSESANLYCFED
jgi:hypothetical protein